MDKETYYNTDLENWCQEIECADPEGNFLERVESTGIMTHPYHFNIYLRKRMPDKTLQHVHTWKDELPDLEKIGCTFGGGTAHLDFEVLPGRYSHKKKRGIRAKINFDEVVYNEKKRIHDNNRFAKEAELAGGGAVGQNMILIRELVKAIAPRKKGF